ncbi:MAG: acetoin utilization protein AcuC [Vulcanibacillus sp.]
MKNNAVFIYSSQLLKYKFKEDHPFNQLRIKITMDLLKKMNALDPSQIVLPRIASDEEIALIHDQEYIDVVYLAGQGKLSEKETLNYGIGTEDTPIFENMHEASAIVVGGTLKAVETVLENKSLHALNIGGGLHHGFRNRASGFCIYNDSAIAIKYITEKYKKRVLYIDTDAHHGDGVQAAFYDTNQVCTVSIHETGRYLFPGTGGVNERGEGKGFGYSFNIPIDAFTEDDSYISIYKTAISEIARYYKPDVIVSQNGADAHYYDPLTHLYCTTKLYKYIPKLAHQIAHEYCEGRWIAVGGGGYDIWRVVPRTWSMLWLEMNDRANEATGKLPEDWIENWKDKSPLLLPRKWEDDKNLIEEIPRKKEIMEINKLVMNRALSIIYI